MRALPQSPWQPIDLSQFSVRECPFDSSANAMVLEDSAMVRFQSERGGFYIVYDYYVRVQILRKEGFGAATIEIPFYYWGDYKSISDFEAHTLNASPDGHIEISKVKAKDIFDEKISGDKWIEKTVFPDIKEGSVIEYHYQTRSGNLNNLQDWYFQRDLPVLHSVVVTAVPDFFTFNAYLLSARKLDAHREFKSKDWISYVNFYNVCNIYEMDSIPALKTEDFITTMDDYRWKLIFSIYSYKSPIDKKTIYYGSSWENVVKDFYENENFLGHLKAKGNFQYMRDARELTEPLSDTLAKIKAIYAYLVHRMRWNGWYNTRSGFDLYKSYKDSTGNSCAVNLILISMLRAAGIRADPVLVSTRDNGKIEKDYPMEREFNHILAVAEVDTSKIILDAINPNRPWYMPGENDLNQWGLCALYHKSDTGAVYNYEWVPITPAKHSSETLTLSTEVDSVGNMHSRVRFSAGDYFAYDYRTGIGNKIPASELEKLVTKAEDVEVTEVKDLSEDDIEKRIRLELTAEKMNPDTAGDIIYLNPFMLRFYRDNPFKISERTFPVDFPYPFQHTINISVDVSPGYKIQELPKSISLMLPDGSATFNFLVEQTEVNIQISSTLSIKKMEFQPRDYPDLKELFAKMIDAYNSVIVLKKQ
ncbi:MAG TPA: DUF3858 domain-containing protein [Chitinophagales bacterium]|nr:DUF3858 domain-containing protein [Chitinophagales bacterium]